MSRTLWFVAGAGAGAYAVVKARRAAEILTVDGLRDRVGAVAVGARMFRDEVAQGKAEAETGLRQRMGLVLDEHETRRALAAGPTDPTDPTDPADPTDRPDDVAAGEQRHEQQEGEADGHR